MIPPPAGGSATAPHESCVYLLQSSRDGTYYVGWTTEPSRRLVEHNRGASSYTRRKRPWRLVGVEWYRSAEEAKAYERALKHQPRMLQLFKKRVLNRPTTCLPAKGRLANVSQLPSADQTGGRTQQVVG